MSYATMSPKDSRIAAENARFVSQIMVNCGRARREYFDCEISSPECQSESVTPSLFSSVAECGSAAKLMAVLWVVMVLRQPWP